MRFTLSAFAMLMLTGPAAFAGPLPWNYTVQFGNLTDTYTLGTETETQIDVNGVERPSTVYYLLKGGFTKMGQAPFGTTDLFGFSQGSWTKEYFPPATGMNNQFTMRYRFGDSGPFDVVGGSISADGFSTSGTGNFTIVLSEDRDITVDGRNTKVHFGTRESESQSVITMTITPEPVPTPEPATLALAGIGIAGLCGFRLRRRIAA